MFATVADYFRSGQRICLFGAFALGEERNRFGAKVRTYFDEWTAALEAALVGAEDSTGLAEEAVAGIHGAIVLSRAMADGAVYIRVTIGRWSCWGGVCMYVSIVVVAVYFNKIHIHT